LTGTLSVSCREITLTRGTRLLFRDLSVSVEAGTALILRGPNGVGKTSLLRIIAGLTSPDAGDVALNGAVVNGLCATRRDAILYAGHANQLKDDLTALENLRAQIALDAVLDAVATNDHEQLAALESVGLQSRRHVLACRLSQGQKRRIGLARLMLCGKPIWLLDEPTNALDQDGVALFEQILEAHLARGGIAILATHLQLAISAANAELVMQEAA
jgi:heme exporter protein A